MVQTAKVFSSGGSQAVRLPADYRFTTNEVFIRRNAETGEVILSPRPTTWEGFFALLGESKKDIPKDFLDEKERQQIEQQRDPFSGWKE